MSDNNQKTYDEIRVEIEAELRAQLEDEVRRRKEMEEKYYKIYEQLQDKTKALEKSRSTQMEMAKSIRDLLTCNISFLQYMNRRRIYRKNEQDILNKDKSFWAPVFDAPYYAENNKDVVAEVGTDEEALLKHFISVGTFQGRQASENFDVERYLEYNIDVAEICGTDKRAAYLHYIDYGMNEKRKK